MNNFGNKAYEENNIHGLHYKLHFTHSVHSWNKTTAAVTSWQLDEQVWWVLGDTARVGVESAMNMFGLLMYGGNELFTDRIINSRLNCWYRGVWHARRLTRLIGCTEASTFQWGTVNKQTTTANISALLKLCLLLAQSTLSLELYCAYEHSIPRSISSQNGNVLNPVFKFMIHFVVCVPFFDPKIWTPFRPLQLI